MGQYPTHSTRFDVSRRDEIYESNGVILDANGRKEQVALVLKLGDSRSCNWMLWTGTCEKVG